LSSAYVIMNERLNLRITILEIDALLLHEEPIPNFVEQLIYSIKNVGCLNHPIIADAESLLVLDGVHRVAALKNLRCKRVPACVVDYKSPFIKIFSWYRTVSGIKTIESLLAEVTRVVDSVKRVDYIDESLIGFSPVVAGVKTVKESFLLNRQFESFKEAYDIIKCIETQLKTIGLEIRYETESDAQQRLNQHQADAVLYTPRLTKQAIIETARSGKIFAYKATRHIIPARPLHLCVPLSLLKESRPLTEVNETLKNILKGRRMEHVPPGSVFEGRRYEEDLYVFEE